MSKEPGQQTGVAQVTVNGKVRRVSRHALQAWPIMDGQNALILSLNTKNAQATGEYHLLFCEGATGKRRDLGAVRFASAEILEQKEEDGIWAFVLSGSEGNQSFIIVADSNEIHGRLTQAERPKLEAGTLQYTSSRTGKLTAIPVSALLATDMTGVYAVKTIGRNIDYVQFLRNGSGVLSESNGKFRTGVWSTDGERMSMEVNGQTLEWPRSSLERVSAVPAGARLVVRLLQPLASNKVKRGDSAKAVLISSASIDGKILIPQGSEFGGTITKAHGVGWAVKHETAALTVEFGAAKTPDGRTLTIHTRLRQVENAREKVNDKGSIQGIRSTGTLGYSAESKVESMANVDPVAYLFSTVSATASLGFAEPEILYPAGTELEIEFTAPLVTSKVFPPSIPALASSPGEQQKLVQFVRRLPFRTMTKGSNRPSDLTNLAFIGSPGSVQRAFKAAGWVHTDVLTASSTFQTFKTIGGNQIYNQAPMSVLLLDERPGVHGLHRGSATGRAALGAARCL